MTYLASTELILQLFHTVHLLQGMSKAWCTAINFGAVTIHTNAALVCLLPKYTANNASTASSRCTPLTHAVKASLFLSANVNTLN